VGLAAGLAVLPDPFRDWRQADWVSLRTFFGIIPHANGRFARSPP
jgi:hypothetical protein